MTGAATTPGGEGGGRRIRVLVAKPGLDGHDRGAKVVARGLRDAGMEVIYTGLHRTPEQIVRTAVDEDVQVVGLSILSGAHNRLVPEVCRALREAGLEDVLVLVGGIIPDGDVPGLLSSGASVVFQPGTPIDEIVSFIQSKIG
jgi:methylmalonyl-CoA mutase C-terminal domain/subunit